MTTWVNGHRREFSTTMNKELLARRRDYAEASDRPISHIVSEAVAECLGRVEVRPAFHTAVDEFIRENEELLKELATTSNGMPPCLFESLHLQSCTIPIQVKTGWVHSIASGGRTHGGKSELLCEK